jgi:amino acid transporter
VPQEDRKERIDRELIELLNELRVALPGVQVLFAFLLVVPFQQGFADVSEIARLVYFAGLASSAIAIAFLIAPASYHRINLRRGVEEKERMLFTSNRLTLIGTAFLAAGIGCSMFVIADVLFGGTAAALIAFLTALVIVLLWYVLPLWARTTGDPPRGTN